MSRYRIAVCVIGVVFVGMLTIFGLGVRDAWHGWCSQGWPKVAAIVIESSVVSQESRVEKKVLHASDNRTTTQVVTLFTPVVKYQFEVAGRQHESDRISISDGILIENRDVAAAVSAKYPVGANVTVFYNPSDLTLAVLEVGISEGAEATLVIGGFFSLMLGGLLAFALSPIGKNVVTSLTKPPSVADDQPLLRKSSKRKKS